MPEQNKTVKRPRPTPALECALGLAEMRQKHGMSIQQISERTKISIRYLKAIEAGDFGKLPGGIYGRSYIRQYALAIDCNADALLTMCPAEMREDGIDRGNSLPDGISRAAGVALLARLLRLATRWQRVPGAPSSLARR